MHARCNQLALFRCSTSRTCPLGTLNRGAQPVSGCMPFIPPMGDFIEDATELIYPAVEPDKDWPVYGVNNKEGVFLNSHQKGSSFNASYKRIRKDWFFHNPTRCNVGSLGIVPDVPEDAITSPEYQVWRMKPAAIPNRFYQAMSPVSSRRRSFLNSSSSTVSGPSNSACIRRTSCRSVWEHYPFFNFETRFGVKCTFL